MKTRWVLCGLLAALLVLSGCNGDNTGGDGSQPEAQAAQAAPETAPPAQPEPGSQANEEPEPEPEDSQPEPEASQEEPVAENREAGSGSLSAASPGMRVVFSLNGSDGSLIDSGTITAYDGETLTLTATSTISGGSVDFFLFNPENHEVEHLEFTASDTVQIALYAGTWAYNCTGFYEEGSFTLDATVG